MPNYIRKSIEVVTKMLVAETPALLQTLKQPRDPFRKVGIAFTGMMISPPQCWVMPRTTDFAIEGQPPDQQDALTVKLGLIGGDPDALAEAVLDYVAAADQALRVWPGKYSPTVLNVFVQRHDYGPLYQKDGGFARFPELHLVVLRNEGQEVL